MLPLLLNSAMDSILKARFDKFRIAGQFPPEVSALKNEGIKPFLDLPTLNEWRSSLSALKITDPGAGYELVGKIDDVLVEADGRLVPADYKSSGNAPAEDKQKYYRDQLAAYGLMFRKHGYLVSDRAYLFHYFVKDKGDPSIDVKFDSHLDPVKIDVMAIEGKLRRMVEWLNKPYPGPSPHCQTCSYYEGRKGIS
jgi:RecB family exonuclease